MERGNNITKINLAGNRITSKSAKTLRDLVKAPKNKRLMSLILDNNNLFDVTIQEIAEGLVDKHQALSDDKKHPYICPIELLSLRRTGIGDKGLIALVNNFDKIAGKNRQGNEDYENMIALDISYNEVTNNGIGRIAQLLLKFNAISSLGLSGLSYELKNVNCI